MPYLVVKVDDRELCRQELTKPVTIGRQMGCEIWLNNRKLSRMHCRVEPEGDKWMLVDLNSHNGTFVNGTRVQRMELRDGDTFEVDTHTRVTYLEGTIVPRRSAEPEAAPIEIPADLMESFERTTATTNSTSPPQIPVAPPTAETPQQAPLENASDDTDVPEKKPFSGDRTIAFSRPPARPIVDSVDAEPGFSTKKRIIWLAVFILATLLLVYLILRVL
jgi:pSer/pThr/pTyr-binding forkhead associated (FHA) protein